MKEIIIRNLVAGLVSSAVTFVAMVFFGCPLWLAMTGWVLVCIAALYGYLLGQHDAAKNEHDVVKSAQNAAREAVEEVWRQMEQKPLASAPAATSERP